MVSSNPWVLVNLVSLIELKYIFFKYEQALEQKLKNSNFATCSVNRLVTTK